MSFQSVTVKFGNIHALKRCYIGKIANFIDPDGLLLYFPFMKNQNTEKDMADLASVLGPASMLDAKFNDSFLQNVFDLDVNINEEVESKIQEEVKLQ